MLVAARCNKEAMSILTMNLMHEITEGRMSVKEARMLYSEKVEYNIFIKPHSITDKLQLAVQKDTADADKVVMVQGIMKEEWQRDSDAIREYFGIKH